MHVLILNQTFYPEVAATAQHMWDLAQHLGARGHRVTALASRTIYGTEQQHATARERVGNIDIHRVMGTAFGKKHLLGRMSDFLSFYAAAFYELGRLPRPDVILALTSPPMIAALGMLRKQFDAGFDGGRVRLAYHVMDLYPDAAEAMGVLQRGSVAERAMARLTQRTLSASDAVIALGRDMADLLVDRYRCRRDRLHIVPPWSDGDSLRPIAKKDNPLARDWGVVDTFNIVYSGNLGMAHDVDTMAGAMEVLGNDPGVRWLFIGGGNRFGQLRDRAAAAGWKHVRFLPYQDREALAMSLGLADVHLVSQLPAFSGIVVPSKLYGIMAVGRPSVMIGPEAVECSRVIRENDCGFVVPNGAVEELVLRLRELKQDANLCRSMGQRARTAFEVQYDRPIACGRIERILTSAC